MPKRKKPITKPKTMEMMPERAPPKKARPQGFRGKKSRSYIGA